MFINDNIISSRFRRVGHIRSPSMIYYCGNSLATDPLADMNVSTVHNIYIYRNHL